MTDPNLDEEKELSSSPSKGVDEFSLTIGYLPSLDQVAALLHEGTTSAETLVAEVRTSYGNFVASRCHSLEKLSLSKVTLGLNSNMIENIIQNGTITMTFQIYKNDHPNL